MVFAGSLWKTNPVHSISRNLSDGAHRRLSLAGIFSLACCIYPQKENPCFVESGCDVIWTGMDGMESGLFQTEGAAHLCPAEEQCPGLGLSEEKPAGKERLAKGRFFSRRLFYFTKIHCDKF
ncbi:hypothetical protein [Ethanoligenens harbinense]|uniref:hypothetical protein n=1 Tax=Ethanoligenens harbinense TaxID=253239 RepID=UPI0010C0AA3D|nr:hypothetical protein [Ethanoligenens harbinense]